MAAVLAAILVLGACSAEPEVAEVPLTAVGADEGTTTTTAVATTTTTTAAVEAVDLPEQLTDHDVDLVVVGDRVLLLAIADSPALRSQGLMGVTDLGDLDGMLFYWRHEASGGFWMKDTLVPLDIVWFAEDGSYAGRASMVPCPPEAGNDCPLYTPDGDPDYRYAIEARPGDLDWVDESTVIVYSD